MSICIQFHPGRFWWVEHTTHLVGGVSVVEAHDGLLRVGD